eukprot:scaffold66095_cov27-Tisochrysis_lutea.AAC.1
MEGILAATRSARIAALREQRAIRAGEARIKTLIPFLSTPHLQVELKRGHRPDLDSNVCPLHIHLSQHQLALVLLCQILCGTNEGKGFVRDGAVSGAQRGGSHRAAMNVQQDGRIPFLNRESRLHDDARPFEECERCWG